MNPIWLWAHPRSRSTALERMMMERGDVTVLHEPLVSLLDEGRVSIPDGPTLSSVAAVVGYATSLPGPVFVKDTTEHRYTDHLTPELAAGITHTFVVREPSAAIASHVAVKPDASCSDIGYENQFLLFELARSLTGTPPVVLDSDLLVRYPEDTVRAYCAAIGLPYRPEALRWRAGDRPEWERTAKWHVAAGRSTGFVTAAPRPVPLTGHLRDYDAHHRPYYDRMLAHALSLSPSEARR
jgi:Sulfotransferase domain